MFYYIDYQTIRLRHYKIMIVGMLENCKITQLFLLFWTFTQDIKQFISVKHKSEIFAISFYRKKFSYEKSRFDDTASFSLSQNENNIKLKFPSSTDPQRIKHDNIFAQSFFKLSILDFRKFSFLIKKFIKGRRHHQKNNSLEKTIWDSLLIKKKHI